MEKVGNGFPGFGAKCSENCSIKLMLQIVPRLLDTIYLSISVPYLTNLII